MHKYVKFIKDILSKKKRLGEFETLVLIKKSLCDLGGSINLVPMSTFKMLGIGDVRPTTVTLQLRDLFYQRGKTLIDVQKGELTMRVQDDQVTFNVLKGIKFPDPVQEFSVIEMGVQFCRRPLGNTLGYEPLKDEQGNENMALMEPI
ncbi:hypothetical protein EPI10_030972 [Gossypium australe]|uniref:Retrovirus-related Pol polyprotein from transposon opus n=1 Tax=Gossypium australe TaxID=47621 RepID=A0A5B6X213_9ROSI|nr:hypothetical protein EPI10_030972 [Gossypium australe]